MRRKHGSRFIESDRGKERENREKKRYTVSERESKREKAWRKRSLSRPTPVPINRPPVSWAG